jgi:hypothetical protein
MELARTSSSAITLRSFGRTPGPTSSTLPPSFVAARKLAAISSRRASRLQRHRVGLALARDDEAQSAESFVPSLLQQSAQISILFRSDVITTNSGV